MKLLPLALLFVVGCGGLRSVAGDSYSDVVLHDGAPTWARTVDQEKWCEWFYPDWQTAKSPWLVVAFDLAAWTRWTESVSLGEAKVLVVDQRNGTISLDGVERKISPMPRAKWVRYSVGNAWNWR